MSYLAKICPKCGEVHENASFTVTNYCFNCGCRLVLVANEDGIDYTETQAMMCRDEDEQ